jgi:hypothetical protein
MKLRWHVPILFFCATALTAASAQICPTGVCVSPNIPVFSNPSASQNPTFSNSNLKQLVTGNITDSAGLLVAGSAGLIVAGPAPWIDVTAPAYGAAATCPAPFTGCTDQSTQIQAAINECVTISTSGGSGCTIFFPLGAGAYFISAGLKVQTSSSASLNR